MVTWLLKLLNLIVEQWFSFKIYWQLINLTCMLNWALSACKANRVTIHKYKFTFSKLGNRTSSVNCSRSSIFISKLSSENNLSPRFIILKSTEAIFVAAKTLKGLFFSTKTKMIVQTLIYSCCTLFCKLTCVLWKYKHKSTKRNDGFYSFLFFYIDEKLQC